MFFILGTNAKTEPLGTVACPCPRCGRGTVLSLCKSYQYLHLFFLPIFRFHVQYIATCPGCASVYQVETGAGRAVERGERNSLSPHELTLLRSNNSPLCPRCGARNPAGSTFCNQCGERLL